MLPPVPVSPERPTLPDLAPADLYEAAYLRLPDEQWSRVATTVLWRDDGPVVTGDPRIDEFERRFWAGELDA